MICTSVDAISQIGLHFSQVYFVKCLQMFYNQIKSQTVKRFKTKKLKNRKSNEHVQDTLYHAERLYLRNM